MKVFVTPEELADNGAIRFIDCRHLLTDPMAGRQMYLEEHLPDAIFAHLEEDLSAPLTGKNGRHPLPDVHSFHLWLQSQGLLPSSKIVLYDNFQGGIAARLWFMLIQFYFDNVYILPVSIEQWKELGLPTSSTIPEYSPVKFDCPISSWDEGRYRIKTLKEIEMEVPSNYLIDSRAPSRYLGQEEPYDAIAGHIPGAINLYWQSHVDSHGNVSTEQIDQSGIDVSGLKEYTLYCGSGVTAALNLAIFEHFNLPTPSIYIGSYSEWSQNHPTNVTTNED